MRTRILRVVLAQMLLVALPHFGAAQSKDTEGVGPPSGTTIIDDLMWATTDNGLQDIDWNGATAYCADLTLGDYDDWGLPTIDELESLYDPHVSYEVPLGYEVHVRNPIQLTACCPWSSTRQGSDSAFAFRFSFGGRYSFSIDSSSFGRALCVRGSRE